MNRFNKVLIAAFMSAAILFATAAQAMKLQQFDRMADQDQIDYISQLVARVHASVSADQRSKVDKFFKARDTGYGEGVSGMTAFELDLARLRSAELKPVAGGMKLQGADVEQVLFKTLQRNGIILPQSFLTVPMSFQPKHTLHQPVSQEVADKWLAQLEAEAARKAGTVPRGLVHKSAAYWSDYKSDMIRQVFEGDFGTDADTDGDARFHILFGTYVEQFSDNCRAYLPSQFDKRTITSTVNGISTTRVINIDYRFLPKYDQYNRSSGLSVQQSISEALNVVNGSLSILDTNFDIENFFSKETCKSAAMRQLGENLLRAANGKPSLQTVGSSIAGAAAESDPTPAPDSSTRAQPPRARGARSSSPSSSRRLVTPR